MLTPLSAWRALGRPAPLFLFPKRGMERRERRQAVVRAALWRVRRPDARLARRAPALAKRAAPPRALHPSSQRNRRQLDRTARIVGAPGRPARGTRHQRGPSANRTVRTIILKNKGKCATTRRPRAYNAAIPPAITPVSRHQIRRTPWTRERANPSGSRPRTSTRATTGAARCPCSAPWASISRTRRLPAPAPLPARPRAGRAREIRPRRAAPVRRQQIRYVTSTKIGEWARDKMSRFALLTRGHDPILWDFGSAAVHHKLYAPWLPQENCKAGLVGLRGTVDPAFGLMKRHADKMASLLKAAGVAKMPLGVDVIEPPMMFELRRPG